MVKELFNQITVKINSLYIIEAYISLDEKKVNWTIFKLQSIGSHKNLKYGFISIDGDIQNGLGTATDNWGKDSIVEAIVRFNDIVNTNDCSFTLEGFEKALEIKNEKVKELQKQLDMK